MTTPIPQRTHELLEALDRAVVTLPRMLQSTAVAAVIAFRPLLYTGVFWLVALKRKLLDELEEVPKLPPGAVVLAVALLAAPTVGCVPPAGVAHTAHAATADATLPSNRPTPEHRWQTTPASAVSSLTGRPLPPACGHYVWLNGTDLTVTSAWFSTAGARLLVEVEAAPGVLTFDVECRVDGRWERPFSTSLCCFSPCRPSPTREVQLTVPPVWLARCATRRLVLTTQDTTGRERSPRAVSAWESC